jgi:hypothetical protein
MIENGTSLPSATETISGFWTFSGGGRLMIENGTSLPSTTPPIADGRLFWNTTTRTMHIGGGGVWNEVTVTVNSRYNAPIVVEYGSQSTSFTDAYLNTQWSVSSTSPFVPALNGTIKSLAASFYMPSVSNHTSQFLLRKWSVASNAYIDMGATITVSAPAPANSNSLCKAYADNINVDFSAGDFIACYVNTTNGTCRYPHIYVECVWRL